MLIGKSKKNPSLSAATDACLQGFASSPLAGRQCTNHVVRFGEHIGYHRVVGPSSFNAISHQSRRFQHLQVIRQPRLRCIKRALEIAHALFSIAKHPENPKSGFIRQRVKKRGGTFEVEIGKGSHNSN